MKNKYLSNDEKLNLIINSHFKDEKLLNFSKLLENKLFLDIISLIGIVISFYAIKYNYIEFKWYYLILISLKPISNILIKIIRIILRSVLIFRIENTNYKSMLDILKNN